MLVSWTVPRDAVPASRMRGLPGLMSFCQPFLPARAADKDRPDRTARPRLRCLSKHSAWP